MLKVTLTFMGTTIPMPDIIPGETGSLKDSSDNTLVLFKCNDSDDGGIISRSMYGYHIEEGDQRAITSCKLKELATIPTNGGYSLKVTTKHGEALMSFVHVKQTDHPQRKNESPDRKKSAIPSGKNPQGSRKNPSD